MEETDRRPGLSGDGPGEDRWLHQRLAISEELAPQRTDAHQVHDLMFGQVHPPRRLVEVDELGSSNSSKGMT